MIAERLAWPVDCCLGWIGVSMPSRGVIDSPAEIYCAASKSQGLCAGESFVLRPWILRRNKYWLRTSTHFPGAPTVLTSTIEDPKSIKVQRSTLISS